MTDSQSPDDTARLRSQSAGDTVLASVALLAGATILQRTVGLGRNVLFCGLMSDDQLGRWSLAFNFLMLAGPLVVLGLPGSFGRYAERYRQRGQLRSFLLRTSVVAMVATLVAIGLMQIWPEFLADWIFGDAKQVRLVRAMSFTLATVIAFNFLIELFTAVRFVRFASLLQLISSLSFAAAGVALMTLTARRESAVIYAYGIASLLAVIVGMYLLTRFLKTLPDKHDSPSHRELWTKLLPFAGWIWASNLLGNLFEVADQFMLKYFSGLPPEAADSLVGQYYCSRVVPLLLLSLAAMISSSLLPHLARDWETGKRDRARARLQLTIKLAAVFFTVLAATVLVFAPLLFDVAWGGRYAAGQAVMPATLTYCVWFCLAGLALGYLMCAEVAWFGSIAFLVGLITNISLNYFLAPRYGLGGVVLATLCANAVALLLVMLLTRWRGMTWDRGVLFAVGIPSALLLGGVPAIAVVAIVLLVSHRGNWLFTTGECDHLKELAVSVREKLPSLRPLLDTTEEVQC